MTYKNIIDKENDANKVGARQNNQTYNADGFAGGMINGQRTIIKSDTTETMDVATLNADYIGMGNTCFDGRYLYFHNKQDSKNYIFLRYDTEATFTAGNVEAFDLSTVNAGAREYSGFTFDGRYVYGVPYGTGASKHGLFFRYDTQASFTNSGSYTVYDITAVDSNAKGLYNACFDGRYIYLCPFYNGTIYVGKIIRYDTTASFSAAGSYSVFDLSTINSLYVGYIDTAVIGEYVYFFPYENNTNRHGNLIRYKIGETFTSSASYEAFNLASIDSDWVVINGNCFDGRYLYMATYSDAGGGTNDRIIRYDTTREFDNSNAYEDFRTSVLSPDGEGYRNMFFDGRYIYVGSYYDITAASYFADIPVYDTWKEFDATASWYLFDRTGIDADLVANASINFDGEYLYIFPFTNASATYVGKISRHKIKLYNVIRG